MNYTELLIEADSNNLITKENLYVQMKDELKEIKSL